MTVANHGLEVRLCRYAMLLDPPNNCTTMLRYFNNDNNTVQWHTTSQIEKFTTDYNCIIIIIILSHFGHGGLLRSQTSILAILPMISSPVVCTELLVLAIWCLSCVQRVISIV
jgi:hypothetical protein